MAGARVGQRRTVALHVCGKPVERRLQLRQVGRCVQAALGLGDCARRLGMRLVEAGQGFGKRRAAGSEFAGRSFRLLQRVARGVEPMLRVAPALPGRALGFRPLALCALGIGQCLLGRAQSLRRGQGFGIELGQAVLLRQALRGGSRRIGACHQSVPAPQRAVAADKALAGRQHFGQPLGIGCNHDADLRQSAGELRRRLDHAGQRQGLLRQGGIARLRLAAAPMGRRVAVERNVEILAERGAQRRLVTALDLDLLEHCREQVAGRGIQDLCKRARLGLDARQLGPGLLQRRAQRRLVLPQRRDGLFGGKRCLLGRGHRRRGVLDQHPLFRRIGEHGDAARDLVGLALDIGDLPRQAVAALDAVAQQALVLVAGGGRFGALGGQFGERGFAGGERGRRLGDRGLQAVLATRGGGILRRQRRLFIGKALQDVGIVVQHLLLACDVGVELGDALVELGLAGTHAAGLFLELGAGDRQALEGSGSGGLGVAQLRQAVRADRLLLGGVHLLRRALGDQPGRNRQRRLRLRLVRLGKRPAQMQQRRLGLADVGGQVLEARRLPRLPLQAFDLAFELADHVVETFEVLLGGAQPELGLVAAGMQAGDAGGFLEQRAARLRLGLDQLADAALPDHRRRARAGRLVGKQQLHVLGARFLAVDAVDRAGLALDAARHLQFVGVVEGGGRGAVAIVEEQRHLGGVARGPRRRAREDDVVHAGRAHVLVRAFAHDPAQRFDEIGLAAAVRPDHARQAALDHELGRFDERLEAKQAEAIELHPLTPGRAKASDVRRCRRVRAVGR